MGAAQDWGEASGYLVSGPDGHPGGVRGDGCCDAVAAGGNERGVCLGVRSGGTMREMATMVDEEDL